MDFIIVDIFIILSLLVLLGAFMLVLFSVWHSMRMNKRVNVENGVPVGIIGWGVVALLAVTAIPTLLMAGFTNMCLITALVMLLVATGALIYSRWSSARRGIRYLN